MSLLDKFSLKNRVIVVTGGTGVLGEAFVSAIAQAGAKIVILGRDQSRLEQRIELAKSFGVEAIGIVANVLNEQEIIQAKNEILEHFGTIDGLLNAAGGNIPGATIGPDDNLFDNALSETFKSIELNLYGTIIPTHIFGRVIAEKGKGSIVNISSITASRAMTRVLGYTVAKHGISGYTKWMATELSLRYGDKVRVNAIAPGVFLTYQNQKLLTTLDGSFTERAQKIVNNTPFSRLGIPEDLQGTLIYLLSDASAFVNGETIFVDGGINAWNGV
jgi:NAD(P)-dependent dehydrogenase (short-subunit alcohol dehydrogenase family)